MDFPWTLVLRGWRRAPVLRFAMQPAPGFEAWRPWLALKFS
jgi:hypothetical protein